MSLRSLSIKVIRGNSKQLWGLECRRTRRTWKPQGSKEDRNGQWRRRAPPRGGGTVVARWWHNSTPPLRDGYQTSQEWNQGRRRTPTQPGEGGQGSRGRTAGPQEQQNPPAKPGDSRNQGQPRARLVPQPQRAGGGGRSGERRRTRQVGCRGTAFPTHTQEPTTSSTGKKGRREKKQNGQKKHSSSTAGNGNQAGKKKPKKTKQKLKTSQTKT